MNLKKVFKNLCKNVDSPVSRQAIKYVYEDVKSLVNMSLNPRDYNDPVAFAEDYACVSFLKKYEGLNTGIDTAEVAIQKFRKAEDQCLEANDRLRTPSIYSRLSCQENAIIHRAQELMISVWGHPSCDELLSRCGWGPGSTESLKGETASREHKMSQLPVSITPAAVPEFRYAISHDKLWLRSLLGLDLMGPPQRYAIRADDIGGPFSLVDSCFTYVDTSRRLTVPKDARSDRVICAEPTANCFLQKGIGGYLRSRLRRFGINLDDQGLNQALAKNAYNEGLSTLDLSAASDTISIGVVKLLCPSEMFSCLNRLRTPAYMEGEVKTRFHKFSSMGNGFTFELESAIFYCLVRAVKDVLVSDKPIGVYGDDIICGCEIAETVIHILQVCGFSLNTEKSFINGDFFESCGKHYFKGLDVTPPYQKHVIDGDLEYIRCYNRLFDWTQRMALIKPDISMLQRVTSQILCDRPDSLKKVNCFGYEWMKGDGFFRVLNPRDIPFRFNRGYKLQYLEARKPRRISGSGGLYASVMREVDSIPPRRGLFDDDAWGVIARANHYDSSPTNGYCDIRPSRRVTQYRLATRFVNPCFGELSALPVNDL